MKKIINKSSIAIIIFSLTSCIAMRSPDRIIDSAEKLIADDRANKDETNIGIRPEAQILYLPMYGLYAGLSTIFLPFNKEVYKQDIKTIFLDPNKEENFDPSSDPKLFIAPSCKNNQLFLTISFYGKKDKLMQSNNGELINNYEIRQEDIYLKHQGVEIKPSKIFIAGTRLDKVSSRYIEIKYPIARKRRTLNRFIIFPQSCSIDDDNAKLVISKIYKDNKVLVKNITIKIRSYGPNSVITLDGKDYVAVNLNSDVKK